MVAAWVFFTETREVVTTENEVENREIIVPQTTNQKPDFTPEFLNVPDLEADFDYFKLRGSLIDLASEGIYRRSEVVAKNGETWLVLVKEGDTYSLKKSTAKVRKLNSISWPGDEKDSKLTFGVEGTPIIALRNIRGISYGSVLTLFLDESRIDPDVIIQSEELSNGYRREFNLNGRSYTLRTSTALSKDGVRLGILVLESEGITQIVEYVRHFPGDRDIIGTLLWAGDIDRDGKLDLYFDQFNEIGAFSSGLYLSSYAKQGNLLDLVAIFGTAGS